MAPLNYPRLNAAHRLLAIALGAVLIFPGCSGADDDRDKAKKPAVPALPSSDLAAVSSPQDVAAGRQALAEGNYAEAVDLLTRAISNSQAAVLPSPNATEAQIYYERGVAYLKMGFPDTAAEDFTTAINLAPHDGRAFQQRARAYVELGDSYKALRDATEAIRLKPDNAAAYHIRGLVYSKRGQYQRAVADLEHAVEQNPELSAEVAPRLADAYEAWSEKLASDGEQIAAAEKLAKARELQPANGEVDVVVTVEKPASVEQTVAKPVIDEAEKKFSRGREFQLDKAYDQAIIEYTEAIALRHDFDAAYLRRGETLLALGFPDTALEDLRRAAHRNGESAEVYQLQAKAHMALKNPHRAALSATDALHVDPTDAAMYALRGEAYLQLQNWDRAVADMEEAIRREPSLRPTLEANLATARRQQAAAALPEQEAEAEI
jgi:tetratricopeptide (TPR) repeat protein